MDPVIKEIFNAFKQEEEEGKKLFIFIFQRELISAREFVEEVFMDGPHDLNTLISLKKEHILFSQVINTQNSILKEYGISIRTDLDKVKPLALDSIPNPNTQQEFCIYYNFVEKLSEICYDIFSRLTEANEILDITEEYDIDKAIKVNYYTFTIAKECAYSTAQFFDNSLMESTNRYS